ncbi:MAG: T9SS type A sorting domain-containing protein, partial [Candidatus Zixiibacteriota bacterium]
NDAYLGTHTVVIDVTDGCNTTSCTFTIHVAPTVEVVIEKTHDTYQGMYEFVSISLTHGTEGFGGYDLLISYDASALNFVSAAPGDILTSCGFEYFTYRPGIFGNCSGHSTCPSGFVRLVAIADMNNGANHPLCYGQNKPGPGGPQTDLAVLKFFVTNDRTFECQYVPIQFWWMDCGDNTFSSITGDTLLIANHVYAFDAGGEITGDPGFGGWQGILPAINCMNLLAAKYHPDTVVNFHNGGIDIACADSIDAPGDLNLNDIPYEIADAVLYTNYFLYGLAALDANPTYRQAQIAASDCNQDGTVLSVGDLVYLLRVIVGDALPFGKLAPFTATAEVAIQNGTLSTSSSDAIGAMYLTYDVTGEVSVTSNTTMKVDYAEREGKLHILVWSGLDNKTNAIPYGTTELLTVTGADLSSVEVADYYGNLMNVRVAKQVLPTEFALSQNTPNPFNPLTKIGFDLPVSADWKLDIYNINGQLVQSYNGTNIGHVDVSWDALNTASGIYFYKLTAGSFTETKKMVLMK